MKYLIDFSCPTDVLLFKGLKEELENRGHTVFLTTRNFGHNYISRLAEQHGLTPDVIGSHGRELYDKLVLSGTRVVSLATHIKYTLGLDDFCGVISNSNPEICRVGFGLGLKVFSWNDSPDLQVAQTKLTSALSDWIFTPWVVPKESFIGVSDRKIFQYDCLFPMAWLPELKLNPFIIWDLKKLTSESVVVAFRESETRSAYLDEDISIEVVKRLADNNRHWNFITSPRYNYDELVEKFKGVPDNVCICPEPIDFPSLLSKSALFIGGGGTMMIEAAYFGTPVISTRVKTTYYEQYLMEHDLVKRVQNVDEAVESAERYVKGKLRTDNSIFKDKKYPIEKIVFTLENLI